MKTKQLLLILFIITSHTAISDDALEILGERIFNDDRFSEFFFKQSKGDVNHTLSKGSLELQQIIVNRTVHDSPFSDQAMSCSSCHMVDQAFDTSFGGMRGYNDFAPITPIPIREDGRWFTVRNTPTLVGIGSKYAQNRISHHDGEFFDHSSTVLGNFLGRNMGWLDNEKSVARKNIINVITNDDGTSQLAKEFGGSYQKILLGVDPSITEEFRLSEENRIDVYNSSEDEIINIVVKAVTAYMNGLDFEKTENGDYSDSPYDKFLIANNIANGAKVDPNGIVDIVKYSRELISSIKNLKSPKFISSKYYPTHRKEFKFGADEFEGLKIFLNISKRGMCINCHLAPLFTDQIFHNIGTTQIEYDNIHGKGTFANLEFPNLSERKSQYYLKRPSLDNPKKVDLGVWNFFGRNDKKQLTNYIKDTYCGNIQNCNESFLLPHMTARFKTPTLRNLNHSAPYLHNGSHENLDGVIEDYINASKLIKNGELVNGAPQLRRMNITSNDTKFLRAFLNSLNSVYE